MIPETSCQFTVMTASTPGAIAIVQLCGEVMTILQQLTGRDDWPVGRLRLVSFDGIDEGLAGRPDASVAQLMPHGGLRVVQRLCARLVELGTHPADPFHADSLRLYPEAADEIDALMLDALAWAASPLAIDALLAQPNIWRRKPELTSDDRARSVRLRRLLDPPQVVLAGAANVGKSTLSNTLAGRSVSIALDAPGTTRDYTTARLDLGGLAVHWHDTPGLRATRDAIESKAISLARRLIAQADFLIAITDAAHDWPALPRAPDLRVASKADLQRRTDADCSISAVTGEGVSELVTMVRERLVPRADLDAARSRPWLFDPRLAGSPLAAR